MSKCGFPDVVSQQSPGWCGSFLSPLSSTCLPAFSNDCCSETQMWFTTSFVFMLSSGFWLCVYFLFAFICFSSFVSRHVSPNLSFSQVSPIIRLLLDLFPRSFDLQFYLCLASSWSHSCFLFVSVLYSLCVFLLSQIPTWFMRKYCLWFRLFSLDMDQKFNGYMIWNHCLGFMGA